MYKRKLALISIWTAVSVFSYSDFSPAESMPQENNPYQFEPDAGSPGAEVAPLDVNAKDEDVPYPAPSSSPQNKEQNYKESTLPPIQPIFYQSTEQ